MALICLFFLLGYYAFIETSSPRVKGDVARIFSPVFDDTYGECLHMWYHMNGQTIGQLSVYGYDTVTQIKTAALFSLSGVLSWKLFILFGIFLHFYARYNPLKIVANHCVIPS